ncbi:TonB-dependent receptor plug domain-containing protein [Flammeovirgaceae bacterium SG7u.111]|nr:TonB-dependent receptor plug domain-containing protein [Flammeovirgaceae bacterium SG7u.132]WPO33395.1 TonB-dependent receptor plug domain-containing protein [Flammeovirgaceae bacterium SG7u.111]
MRINFTIFFLAAFILSSFASAYAQNTIYGKIVDEKGSALPGVAILIKESKNGTITDNKGEFRLSPSEKKCTIEISGVGLKKQLIAIDFDKGSQLNLGTVVMLENTQLLSEVVVEADETAFLQQKAFSVTAVDAKPMQIRNMDVNQLLNRTSGVRIRETGGLGSKFSFTLNGLSGNQVKIFIDDIPMDIMGRAYGLNNFPVNLIDRVEVYKGVVPINLGSDALGGSVNIVTDNSVQSFLDASYSFGSFNTHRAALIGRKYFKDSGFSISLKSFYNYSANNYTMYGIEAFDENSQPYTTDTKRFHDTYKSMMGHVEVGFNDRKWADKFMIGAAFAELDQDLQTSFSLNPPFGEVKELEDSYFFNLNFRKSDIGIKNLDLNLFAQYSEVNNTKIDTSSYVYNWQGGRKPNINPTWGEALRIKTYFDYVQTSFLQRAFLNYDITNNQSINLNYITTHFERQGENRFGTSEEEPFRSPNTLTKHVAGLSYEINLFEQDLSVIPAVKYYNFATKTRNVLTSIDGAVSIEDLSTSLGEFGYSLALRYYVTRDFYLKSSYEKGYRIPEPDEIFGDGLTVLANPFLLPESANNFNFGGQYAFVFNTDNSLQVGFNLFHRDVHNFIRERNNGRLNQHENVLDALISGLEVDIKYKYKERFNINGNLTWQKFINNTEFSSTGNPNPTFGLRIPNEPYLFANLGLSYTFKPIFDKVELFTYYNFNYVHSFLLGYDILSGFQNEIPTQYLQNVGVTALGPQKRHSVSFEVSNIFNALAYDEFKLQKPGRAFNLKWRYFIN